MNLPQAQVEQFYKLWYALAWNINEKHKIVPPFKKPVYGEQVNIEQFLAIRSKLWENPQWIDDYLQGSEAGELTETECETLKSWRKYFIKAQFLIIKHLKQYCVFMSFGEPAKLYGVCGISEPIKNIVTYKPPCMVETALLPFNDKIIYDGFLNSYAVSFGKGMKSSIKEAYEKAQETAGIIERIGEEQTPLEPPKQKRVYPQAAPTATEVNGAKVPKTMMARYMEIAELIEKFCGEKLNAEYNVVCLKALAKLCRKRPSPLTKGKVHTWACGIVYAIGSVNFIFDKSQPINMTATEISEWFGISKNTAGGKAKEIKDLLNLSFFNAEFLLESNIEDNPAVWLLSVNGLPVDIREMPVEAQEEAFRKGLIPYIPAYK